MVVLIIDVIQSNDVVLNHSHKDWLRMYDITNITNKTCFFFLNSWWAKYKLGWVDIFFKFSVKPKTW